MHKAMRVKGFALALAALPAGAAAAAAAAGAAAGGAGNFTLVNGTAGQLTSVMIRTTGTDAWRPLPYAASPGGRAVVQFSDPECAFDIRGMVGAAAVTWPGVNLCEVTTVTLNRNASGIVWADYD